MTAERIGLRGAGWRPAGVRDVELQVAVGDSVGLVGPSGAGKTTIARMLAGLLRPTQGHLLRDGVPLRWPPPRPFHRAVQYLHQAPALDPLWTLEAHMREARRAAGLDERWQPHWESVGLSLSLAGRRPQELSGGQRHRAALARALAVEPKFLVLDEPTQGQDPPRVRDFEALLAGWGTRGLVVLSHELGLVERWTRWLGMVDAGRLVEFGPTEQLLQDPQHQATRRWVEAARVWAGDKA